MSDLSGLTALITGAAGGIGLALAEAFAKAGARLALVDMKDCSDLAAKFGPEHRGYTLDLSDPAAIAPMIERIGTEMGIDLLINNAGLGMVFPAEEVRLDDWDRTMAINLRAPWLVSAAALPFLKASGRGRIVNLSSQAGVIALDQHAAYGASKAGLIGLTKVQALEWARHGVTVNAIAPTVVDTPMGALGWSGEKGEKARRDIPMGRFVRPPEVAAAAVFLCSADAGMITGDVMMIDGGFTMQ